MKTLNDLYQQAAEFAKRISLDDGVRTVAKSGGSDEARINYRAKWETADVSATFGAGTDMATVKLPDGTVLYQAYDYGRHLEVLRHGPWVTRLMTQARQIKRENQKQQYGQKREAIENEMSRFSPIDY